MKRALLMAAAAWSVGAGIARSDQITTVAGQSHFGRITNVSPVAVTFDGKNGSTDIQANEIAHIFFEGLPENLIAAQKAASKGDYAKALDALKKESLADKRKDLVDEITFTQAYCMAMLAAAGEQEPVNAGKQLYAFISNSPTSFHYYKACEMLGDIFVMMGNFPEAGKYYGLLGKAPWPDYKIRAEVALGRSYLAQNNAAAAEKAFDDALAIDASGDQAEPQRMAARVGKARCLILKGKLDQAQRGLNDILAKSDERPAEINAMLYNALGTALRKAGKPNEAIRAFLRVHLEYAPSGEFDAEAVANLEKLFKDTKKNGHAADMHRILSDRYANSPWAKGVN